MEVCRWKWDDEKRMWFTDCGFGVMFFRRKEALEENKFRFCPHCGKRIEIKIISLL